MPTVVMSTRVDADQLKFADKLAKEKYGCNFAKFCKMMLSQISINKAMPIVENKPKIPDKERKRILVSIKKIGENPAHPEIALMSDKEIRDLIAERYIA